jgi:hypothetical protein
VRSSTIQRLEKHHYFLRTPRTIERLKCAISLQGLGKSLTASGATELSFNAITALSAAKVLQKIADSEAMPLRAEEATCIAACSGGDLLNAIETLQLYSCGKIDLSLLHAKKGKKVRP